MLAGASLFGSPIAGAAHGLEAMIGLAWEETGISARRLPALGRSIEEHENKVRRERMRPNPDEPQITHWEHEIDAHEKRLQVLLRRLKREW